MKIFEKVLIIIAVLAGIGGLVAIFTLILGNSARSDNLTLPPFQAPLEGEALVIHVSGEVFLFRENHWRAVVVGDLLREKDTVKTFRESSLDVQVGNRLLFSIRENTVVRLRELLHTDTETRSECEILAGVILCRLQKLADGDGVTIRSGAAAFGVRGTELIVERRAGTTLCGVTEGRVAVLDAESGAQKAAVLQDQEIRIDEATGEPGTPFSLTESRRKTLGILKAVKTLDLAAAGTTPPVKIAVRVEPADAEILLEGLPVGYGSWSGIFPAGTQLPLTLKKAGYREQGFTLSVKAGENRIYEFRLELEDPEKGIVPDTAIDYEERIEKLESDLEKLNAEKTGLANTVGRLRTENARLLQELEDARKKIENALNQLQ